MGQTGPDQPSEEPTRNRVRTFLYKRYKRGEIAMQILALSIKALSGLSGISLTWMFWLSMLYSASGAAASLSNKRGLDIVFVKRHTQNSADLLVGEQVLD
jgi:hypothetical protein